MRKTLLFLVIIFFCFPPPAQAEIKTFVHTVRQPFSGSQSPDDARVAAIHKAKREVLEKAGTYLQTLTVVEDGRLTKDQILALTGGVLKTEIISQEPYVTGEGFGIIIKVKVKVDTNVLEDRVTNFMADGTAMEQLTNTRKREKELLERIDYLEEVNQRLAKTKESETVKKRKKELQKDFQQTTRGLDAVTLFYQAVDLWKNGEFTNPRRAIKLLNEAIKLDPGYVWAYNNRGIAYNNLKQYNRAIQDYNKAIELDPGVAEAYTNRGKAYDDLKQHIKAIQNFDKAIELKPDYAMAYNNRGKAYQNLKQYNRAIQDIDKAIDLDPGLAMAYNNRGTVYANRKQYDRAIREFDRAIELNPGLAKSYYNRGAAYDDLKQYDRAIREFDRAIELNPGYVTAYNNRGIAYQNLKQYNRAIQDYNKAIELDPGFAEAYTNRGNAYLQLKRYARVIQDFDYNRAIQDFDKAIELDPGVAMAYNNRGIVYLMTGRVSQGCNDLKKACELGSCGTLERAMKRGYCP